MDNECYLFINYSEKELISHYLGKSLQIMRKVNMPLPLPAHGIYWHMALLSESDINYIKLSFPKIELVHEGGKYDYLNFNYTNIKVFPKNIEVDNLYLEYATGIHYIHSSIKINIFHSYDNQLYHIPKCVIYDGFSSYGIKNYEQEKEKLLKLGEKEYYKIVDEQYEIIRKNHLDNLAK